MKTFEQLLQERGLKDPRPSKFQARRNEVGPMYHIEGTDYQLKIPVSLGCRAGNTINILGHPFRVVRTARICPPGTGVLRGDIPPAWLIDLNNHPLNTEETEPEQIDVFA